MRLTRMGARKRPSYRVVVADSRAPRDGRHVDILGFYDPMTTPSTVRIDTARAVRWLRHGAQPTERVRILLRHAGVLQAHEAARLADKRARREAQASETAPAPPASTPPAAGEGA
jgi:small subunit ribosomal protein S16